MACSISDTLDTIEAMVCQEERAYHPARVSMEGEMMQLLLSPSTLESRRRMMIFYYDLVEKVGSSRQARRTLRPFQL